ncbi:MAG TPA: NAD-glutamate dehydrogenase [Coxiellaceae bacterium]|nr:MAG: NAD-glutamate dehydrogenase [Gammaproteobacteria bacterium RIFCSPHIGHO2_12_FULL_36_30]HLB56827.1 NAD-glutamate dehydrogenase [Coxiellaceae bacterium]
MPIADRPSIKSLIANVTEHAKTQIHDEKQYVLFSNFVRLFYSHASENDLKQRSVTELFGMAYSQWMLVCSHEKQTMHIRVFNPDLERDGWHTTHTVIEVMMEDMPFIVDSMQMEMNRLNFTVHLMIYMGGMKICRDINGLVVSVDAYNAEKKHAAETIESPVYMEIDRQTDPKILLMIEENIRRVLSDVKVVVQDWLPMQKRVQESIDALKKSPAILPQEEVDESIAFLEWLLDGQFTFLGVRDYKVTGKGDAMALCLIPKSGLGVLRDESQSKVTRLFSEMPDLARESMLSPKQLLVISKTNTVSSVHRQVYTDYIGIKQFDKAGQLIGERRILGMYTSTAYNSHPKQIPFLRHKVVSVMEKSGLPPKSHAGKDLMNILETFPRDDLFQATTDDLYRITTGILNLQDRRKISAFVREDAYGRYVSCLVFVPRDNFNSQLIVRIQDVLMETFHGINVSYSTYFYTPILTRIHYIIRVEPKKKLEYNLDDLLLRLSLVAKSWQDGFKEAALDYFGEERGNQIVSKYGNAFSAGYREAFSPMHSVIDIEHIEALKLSDTLGMSLYRPSGSTPQEIKFKLFRYDQTVPLSDALPILENMGLRVIEERPYQLTFKEGRQVWINDFDMVFAKESSFDIETAHTLFQEAFNHIWLGNAENDLLNALVLEAQLSWREVAVLRAYTKYLRQTGFTYSPQYVSETFLKYPLIAKTFVELFHRLFDPAKQSSDITIESIETKINKQIEDVILLDEDRIFRRVLFVIKATLRTNFYQCDATNKCKVNLSFKLSPEKIPEMPLPLPKFEIFVYSPRFEGVHLRMAKVARGGLRWSDRREDFRTEVLGLMKAQQVKNAVIVPSGAKGGFVPKNLPINGTRDEIMQEGIACYKGFIQALLDITDNIVGLDTVRPAQTVCYDEFDPYFVVAADKGTATFSDIANQIAIDNHFWLGDAFASGGSTGYDHKKMGITARGAWVSAERHFQGLNINVDNAEITVVGIGDLSGDVFGNGVLLSAHLKLVAAFNHMHIFIDPTPNPQKSFEERQRMFALPRSTWADYRTDLISQGGGVFSRAAKYIPISPEIKALLDIADDRLAPNELIRAILKAPVDMIWNGGIGTYVKAAEETNADVGDRTNDSVRVNGADLRSRVVVEGGNLGFTQLGRIEYALLGGLMNTDFIDNSAGVDCSDHEVNIKILLNTIVESGDLTEKQRNELLASMTDEVANLVLQNNYHQNQSVSFLSLLSPKHISLYMRYLDVQEQNGRINRALEFLPDSKTLLERRANDLGLTRPEISVLLSYSKIILKEDILQSDLIDDASLKEYMKNAFPTVLCKKYSEQIFHHRLRHELLATQLSNHLVSHMGITFVYQMLDETGASISAIVRAFFIAYDIFDVAEMISDIEGLDYRVEMLLQYQMLDEVIRLVRRATRWLLRNAREQMSIENMVPHFEPHIQGLYKRLPKLLLGSDKEDVDARKEQLIAAQVPEEIATKIASVRSMYHALNIIEAADARETDVYQVAQIYFMLVDRLDLHWFRDKINDHPVTHRWSVLAKAAFKGDLDWIQRELTASVIALDVPTKDPIERVDAWLEKYRDLIARWRIILTDLRSEEITDFSIVSVAIRELFDLAQASRGT